MANDRLAGQQAVGSLSVPLPVAEEPVPIFSFANGELGFLQNRTIRLIERLTGQPRIKNFILIMWMINARHRVSGRMRWIGCISGWM